MNPESYHVTLIEHDRGIQKMYDVSADTPLSGSVVACTVVTVSQLAHARSLADSLHDYHPDLPFVTLVVDSDEDYLLRESGYSRMIGLDALDIDDQQQFRFRYTAQDLCQAAVPHLLSKLHREGRHDKVLYLHPETVIRKSLTPLLMLLDRYPMLLIVSDTGSQTAVWRITHNNFGSANRIFLALLATTNALGSCDLSDIWKPPILADYRVLHSMPNNEVYRCERLSAETITLQGAAFCKSLWHPGNGHNLTNDDTDSHPFLLDCRDINPDTIARFREDYDSRTSITESAEMTLARWYSARLSARGFDSSTHAIYRYSHFDNGVLIPGIVRAIYLALGNDAQRFGNPFEAADSGSFFQWLNEPAPVAANSDHGLSRLWWLIYEQSPNLKSAFPHVFGRHHADFCRWAARFGLAQYDIPPRLARSIMRHLAINPRSQKYISDGSPIISDLSDDSLFGVNISGHISSEKGVGEAVRSAVRILEAASIPYVVNDFADPGSANIDHTVRDIALQNPYHVNLITLGAGEVTWFARQIGRAYFSGRYNIGHLAWELEDFPFEWVKTMQFFDEIWTASSFIRDSLSAIVSIPVHVVPYTVTSDISQSAPPALRHGLPKDTFVFLSVFDFESYVERKNPLAVIEAFKRAFRPEDNALLILKCMHSTAAQEHLRAMQQASIGANIRITDRVMSRGQIHELFSAADCYVSLHRSEGFGLTIAEAMRLAKPVIATGYSGNMDFMTKENAFPCEYRLVPVIRDAGPYKRGYVWADPDIEHAAALMRDVYECRSRAVANAAQGQRDVQRLLHPMVVGTTVRERLAAVAGMR